MSHIHVRIHHWVVWWFCLGIVLGAIALVNILFRDLTRMQERIVLILGAVNWILGGVVCWAFEGVQITTPPPPQEHNEAPPADAGKEWHSASEFVQPGSRKSLLPPKY